MAMMISISLDQPSQPAASSRTGSRNAAASGADSPGFGQTLTGLMAGKTPGTDPAADLASDRAKEAARRHSDAAPGKALPDRRPDREADEAADARPDSASAEADSPPDAEMPDPARLPTAGQHEADEAGKDDDDLSEPTLEPSLAWLLPLPAAVPPTPTDAGGTGGLRPARFLPDCEMPVPTVPPSVESGVNPPLSDVVKAARDILVVDPASGDGGKPSVPSHPGADPRRDAPPVILTVPEAVKAAAVPRPIGLELAAAAKGSAAPAAVALEAAGPNAPTAADSAMLAATGVSSVNSVAPAASAHRAGIDLTNDPGLHRMIDRIEQLRDGADVRETRIRLIPDSLGPVDIAVRRAGEGVQVHFTAAEAATRQLIADAQQRLTDLADTRGVRIERAIIDGGTGQQASGEGQSRPQPQQAQQNRAPARAEREAAPETTDDRIA